MKYLSGFGNHFSTEALPGALPEGQNSPQKVPLGLFAEQISGTAFTAPRSENARSWLYRIRPSVVHGHFEPFKTSGWESPPLKDAPLPSPNQLRWNPIPIPSSPTSFPNGVLTYALNGNVGGRTGCAVQGFALTRSMEKDFFYNADGEMLFVPQEGTLLFKTEMGDCEVAPGEIVVIPRGVTFQIETAKARGFFCENFGDLFRLPALGPIGANGLANPRDFLAPSARFEDKAGDFRLIAKFEGSFWQSVLKHSPLNVVAWHGNYTPYKYDLSLFQTINSVSFDHPDPSIFTVLTSPSSQVGTANADFVIFPPRWMVANHTFRPPYYHRNTMSEFMGNIRGEYDAKASGFPPGAASLHNCMSPHGPDSETYERAVAGELKPLNLKDTLSFMFESRFAFQPTRWALEGGLLQKDYLACWSGLKSSFQPKVN